MVNDFFKKILSSNIKSSTRFGESSVFSKNFNAFYTNIGILFKERRFLYFTKKGPIEVVFNIKHYISAFIISVIFLFKTLQFIFFGASTFFTYLIYQNSEINNQTFTESEIQTLKNIAKENKIFDSEKKQIANKEEEFFKNVDAEKDISSVDKLTEKFTKLKAFIKEIPGKFSNDQTINDEVLFEQFSGLASPELVAFEHIYTSNEVLKENKNHKKKVTFSYTDLPVIPFIAPRTNKLKIINFTKKIDREIISLIDVFESLNLRPDNIDLDVKSFLKKNQLEHEHNLIENTSMRFQLLDDLKDAIIYLPLKPPMQYYYISSPYGYRIHPKSKLRQMHYGIDMAGTWQEEVRAPADGFVSFSGRNGSFGKSIKIVHKHGVSTLYGHLHRLSVKKGQYVKEGQVIGKMGSTGRAVGAHLHYEIKVSGKSVNPYKFITKGRALLSSTTFKR